MSFIDDKIKENQSSVQSYTIELMENFVAEAILEHAKSSIEYAIKEGKSQIGAYFYNDDGALRKEHFQDTNHYITPDYYLTRFDSGIYSFFDFPEITARCKKNIELNNFFIKNVNHLNYKNIEMLVHNSILALGAKCVSVHIEYRETYLARLDKAGWFKRKYYEEERVTNCKIKIYYIISW